ncbi:MAG: ABC transporter ATP-binding protein [Bradymonadaceae bacterium]
MSVAARDSKPLLEIRNLKKYFPVTKGLLSRTVGAVKAVDDISFDVYPNETVGLVGESGCGKTTAGRSLLRLIEPTSGEIFYKGQDILKLGGKEMRTLRRNLQIIFQDPFSSLNPRMTIEGIIGEAIEFHGIAEGVARREMVEGLLERVGLQPSYITRYPHEFSGGQRQRIGIARALALNPDFIVCDEAVSALDVSVQAQVINLLMDLQEEFNLSYLFIAHDLSVVRHISDRIAVMYLGQIAEFSPCEELFDNPLHPYTQALLSAIPTPNPRKKAHRVILKGDVPSPLNPPTGCRFHTRCPACYAPCDKIVPKTIEVEPGHFVRCHIYDSEHKPTDPSVYGRMPKPPEEHTPKDKAPTPEPAIPALTEDALEVPEEIAVGMPDEKPDGEVPVIVEDAVEDEAKS